VAPSRAPSTVGCLSQQYHKKYLEWCKYHRDSVGAGKAHEALAKSFEK